jgi:hypothetical protein
MKWKPLVAVILILGIFGFFIASNFGQPLIDSLRKGLGDFTGFFIKPSQKTLFSFSLETNKFSLYGLTPTRISNSTFSANGVYQFLKFGDQLISMKNKNEITIYVKNLRGTFSITTDGIVKIYGDSNYMEVDDMIFSSNANKKIEIEIMPNDFVLSNFVTDEFVMPSISGTAYRFAGDKTDTISFQNSKITIDEFVGNLEWRNGNSVISGLASLLKGDKFSFN